MVLSSRQSEFNSWREWVGKGVVTVCKCVCVCMCVPECVSSHGWGKDIETERQRERDGVDGDEGKRRGATGWGQGGWRATVAFPRAGTFGPLAVSLHPPEMGNEIMKGQRWAQPRGSKGEAWYYNSRGSSGLSVCSLTLRLRTCCIGAPQEAGERMGVELPLGMWWNQL